MDRWVKNGVNEGYNRDLLKQMGERERKREMQTESESEGLFIADFKECLMFQGEVDVFRP